MNFKLVKVFFQNYEDFQYTLEGYLNLSCISKIESFKEYPHHYRVFYIRNQPPETIYSEDLTIILNKVPTGVSV